MSNNQKKSATKKGNTNYLAGTSNLTQLINKEYSASTDTEPTDTQLSDNQPSGTAVAVAKFTSSSGSEAFSNAAVIGDALSWTERIVRAKVNDVMEVPLMYFKDSALNARHFYLESAIIANGESMAEESQLVPVRGYVEDGYIVLVDGQMRWRSASAKSLEKLTVIICNKPESEIEHYEESYFINDKRSTQTFFDNSRKWPALIEKGYYKSHADIAKRFNISESNVSYILSIAKVPDSMCILMMENEATNSLTFAREIAKVCNDLDKPENIDLREKIREFIIEQATKKYNSKQYIQRINELFRGIKKDRKERTTFSKYNATIDGVSGVINIDKEKGVLKFNIAGLSEARLSEIRNALSACMKISPKIESDLNESDSNTQGSDTSSVSSQMGDASLAA